MRNLEARAGAGDFSAYLAHARRETEQSCREWDGYQRTLREERKKLETLRQQCLANTASGEIAEANHEEVLKLASAAV